MIFDKEFDVNKWIIKISNKVKDINIKNCKFYFFNGIINIENLDPKNFKIDEVSFKKNFIYYLGYKTIKDSKYIKIYNVNPLYSIFRNVNRYF